MESMCMERRPSAGFGCRLRHGQARNHHWIDNLVAALDLRDNETALGPAEEQEIDVLDRKLATIGQMNGERAKRLRPQRITDFADSHEITLDSTRGQEYLPWRH